MMDRIVVFTQSNDRLANTLFRGYLKALERRSDMTLIAVCLPYPHRNGRLLIRMMRDVASQALGYLRTPGDKRRPGLPMPVFIDYEARRRGFEVLVPPDGNINDPEFIEWLQKELRPTVAISCVCLSKFSPELLSCFDYAVNYHNALLPDYRGLRATAWSLYCGEAATGYTFHLMNEALDEGCILKQESIPIEPDSSAMDLDLLKAELAAKAAAEILDKISTRDRGRPQVGAGSYFSRAAARDLQRIDEPSSLTARELKLRIRAFGSVEIQLDGRWRTVTKIVGPVERPGKPESQYFTTADGLRFRPARPRDLPRIIAGLPGR
jgi:hypothetical protein